MHTGARRTGAAERNREYHSSRADGPSSSADARQPQRLEHTSVEMARSVEVADLAAAGIVAVVRAPTRELALGAVDALVAGGITAVEVTFTVPDALTVIADGPPVRAGIVARRRHYHQA